MQECFYFNVDEATVTTMETSPVLKVMFYNYYDDQEMEIVFKSKEGKVEIRSDSLEVMGEMVQDLMEYVGGKELDSTLTFAINEKQKLK